MLELHVLCIVLLVQVVVCEAQGRPGQDQPPPHDQTTYPDLTECNENRNGGCVHGLDTDEPDDPPDIGLESTKPIGDNTATSAAPPPAMPPEEIVEELTLGGRIPLEYYYVDDSNKGKGTHYKYSYEDITQLIDQAKQLVSKVLSHPPPPPPSSPPHTSTWLTQLTDIWLVHALARYSVKGKQVVVFGSTSPWYESLMLALEAGHVTVIEYNTLTYSHPGITTLKVGEFSYTEEYDIALSLSSFDHDGLGRYGDPINPNGDFVAMKTTKQVMKEGGLFFLTVPVGPDVVVWNLHRRYGNLRLPLLLCGWERVECIGCSDELMKAEAPYTVAYEPVYVLRKNSTIQDTSCTVI